MNPEQQLAELDWEAIQSDKKRMSDFKASSLSYADHIDALKTKLDSFPS